MSIGIAADHAGYRLKQAVLRYLTEQRIPVHDFGVYTKERADYPDQALLVAEAVSRGDHELGVLVCGTGIGMAISANKVPGVRAVVCSDTFSARLAREHNDCNVLCLGERVVGVGLALDLVKVFLDARFLGERHAARVAKIAAIQDRFGKGS